MYAIHVYYGDGKGKTSAAVGQAIRAAGHGWQVLYVRFMKSKESGEIATLVTVPGITVCTLRGKYPFYKDMTEEEKREITAEHNGLFKKMHTFVRNESVTAEGHTSEEASAKKLIVCDELLHALKFHVVEDEIVPWVLSRPAELVLTGRVADEGLLCEADYVTEFLSRRHPYEKGIGAREGIEF